MLRSLFPSYPIPPLSCPSPRPLDPRPLDPRPLALPCSCTVVTRPSTRWTQDPGPKTQDSGFRTQDPGSRTRDPDSSSSSSLFQPFTRRRPTPTPAPATTATYCRLLAWSLAYLHASRLSPLAARLLVCSPTVLALACSFARCHCDITPSIRSALLLAPLPPLASPSLYAPVRCPLSALRHPPARTQPLALPPHLVTASLPASQPLATRSWLLSSSCLASQQASKPTSQP